MSGACNAAGGRNDAFGARKSPRGPATLGPSGTRTLGATETRHSIQCRPTGTPPYLAEHDPTAHGHRVSRTCQCQHAARSSNALVTAPLGRDVCSVPHVVVGRAVLDDDVDIGAGEGVEARFRRALCTASMSLSEGCWPDMEQGRGEG